MERSGSIVRVEAHPESRSHKPVVKPPSTDGSGSWRWRPPEQRAPLRQSTFALNDLSRHTDSSDSLDGRRSVTNTETESDGGGDGGGGGGVIYTNHPHVVHPLHPLHPGNIFQHPSVNAGAPGNPHFNNAHVSFNPISPNSSMPLPPAVSFAPPFHPHPQAITTIRVTPVEGGMAASSDGGSDCQSVASSSRESTLRRKSGAHVGHVGEAGAGAELGGGQEGGRLDSESSNRFQETLRSFQENPIQPIHPSHPAHPSRQLFARPSPTPPPTLPRPILTHTSTPTLGLAYKE